MAFRPFRTLQLGLLFRRVSRQLDRIGEALTAQNVLLARLADHFAPIPPPTEDLQHHTSIDFLNQVEAAQVLDYIGRYTEEQGIAPTEDEVLRYLADEATTDLHERMKEKEAGL